jgi:hypothetical protein
MLRIALRHEYGFRYAKDAVARVAMRNAAPAGKFPAYAASAKNIRRVKREFARPA